MYLKEAQSTTRFLSRPKKLSSNAAAFRDGSFDTWPWWYIHHSMPLDDASKIFCCEADLIDNYQRDSSDQHHMACIAFDECISPRNRLMNRLMSHSDPIWASDKLPTVTTLVNSKTTCWYFAYTFPNNTTKEMSETKTRQPGLPAGRDKSMPTCRTIAFQSRLRTMQLHSEKASMLLPAYHNGWVASCPSSIRPMYPTVAMQCPAHDVLAAASNLHCVIFPVGGVADGDDLAPNRETNG